MSRRLVFVLLLVALIATACGGGDKPAPAAAPAAGDANNGKVLFEKPTLGPNNLAGCVVCHATTAGTTLVGPSLAGMAANSAAALKESIVNPEANIEEGFAPGIMPAQYGEDLSAAEIDDLVAYLLTLK